MKTHSVSMTVPGAFHSSAQEGPRAVMKRSKKVIDYNWAYVLMGEGEKQDIRDWAVLDSHKLQTIEVR